MHLVREPQITPERMRCALILPEEEWAMYKYGQYHKHHAVKNRCSTVISREGNSLRLAIAIQ
jgi:hypothetical protein